MTHVSFLALVVYLQRTLIATQVENLRAGISGAPIESCRPYILRRIDPAAGVFTRVPALTLKTEVTEDRGLLPHSDIELHVVIYCLLARASSRESLRLSMILSMSPRDC